MPRKNPKEYREQQKAKGLCLYCTEQSENGKNRCIKHTTYINNYNKAYIKG